MVLHVPLLLAIGRPMQALHKCSKINLSKTCCYSWSEKTNLSLLSSSKKHISELANLLFSHVFLCFLVCVLCVCYEMKITVLAMLGCSTPGLTSCIFP